MQEIPLELIEHIVSSLHSQPLGHPSIESSNYLDKCSASAVARCALVCRAWVHPSRRILFYCVRIRQYTAYGFARLFRKPERLTFLPFIRELEFRYGIAENPWMRTVFAPKIAKHLPTSIKGLVIDGMTWSPHLKLDPLPRPALIGITRLELAGEWDLTLTGAVECITSFPTLAELVIGLKRPIRDIQTPAMAPPSTLRSAALLTATAQPILQWLVLKNANISVLELSFGSGDTTFLTDAVKFIVQRAEWLSSLCLIFDGATVLGAWNRSESSNYFATLLKTVDHLSFPALKTVELTSRLPPHPFNPIMAGYQELDRLLGPSAGLRRLVVTHVPSYIFNQTEEAVWKTIQARADDIAIAVRGAMPLCAALGVLEARVERDLPF